MDYKYPTPQLLLKAICDAIRYKTGNSDEIPHQNIPDELDKLMTEKEYTDAINNLIEIINGNAEMFSNYITTIGNGRFYANANLTTVNLPECTSIGKLAFYYCPNLTTVNLPKCTSIGNNAFTGCINLTTVNLPECTSIGGYAFYGCTKLTTVSLSNNQVVTLDSNTAFYNTSIEDGTGYIYVPDNLVDSYKTATNWSTHANQIKPISELPSNLKEEYGYD